MFKYLTDTSILKKGNTMVLNEGATGKETQCNDDFYPKNNDVDVGRKNRFDTDGKVLKEIVISDKQARSEIRNVLTPVNMQIEEIKCTKTNKPFQNNVENQYLENIETIIFTSNGRNQSEIENINLNTEPSVIADEQFNSEIEIENIILNTEAPVISDKQFRSEIEDTLSVNQLTPLKEINELKTGNENIPENTLENQYLEGTGNIEPLVYNIDNIFEFNDGEIINVDELQTVPSTAYCILNVGEANSSTDLISSEPKKKVKIRLRNTSLWKSNQRKNKRLAGKEYTSRNGKVIAERSLRTGCPTTCRRKCFLNISEADRLKNFEQFWSLNSLERQRDFIMKTALPENKKQVCVATAETSRRKFSFKYHIYISNTTLVQVCKTMYLNTYDINFQWVETAFQKQLDTNVADLDLRGGYRGYNAMSDETRTSVVNHISSFPAVESHYTRKSTSKVYLEGNLSIPKMYRLYKNEEYLLANKQYATQRQYTDIFNNEFNIGFFMPKKDICETCYKYSMAINKDDPDILEPFKLHQENKVFSRSLKEKDKADSRNQKEVMTVCFDMQKVLITPFSDLSVMYYKRKLAVYNLSFFELGYLQGHCFMWDETTAKRGANEISSCLFYFVEKKIKDGCKDFRFWSDNCCGQNRNRIVYALYMYLVNKFDISISHKFFEVGHTQNENDSIHALIERKKKGIDIYVPDQWYTIARTAKETGKKYNVIEMSQSQFYDFKCLLDIGNWNVKLPWNKMKEVFFRHDDPNTIYYKFNLKDEKYNQEIISIDLVKFELKILYETPIPISNAKYKDLLSLCKSGAIPEAYHKFYNNLKKEEATKNIDFNSDEDMNDQNTSKHTDSTESSTKKVNSTRKNKQITPRSKICTPRQLTKTSSGLKQAQQTPENKSNGSKSTPKNNNYLTPISQINTPKYATRSTSVLKQMLTTPENSCTIEILNDLTNQGTTPKSSRSTNSKRRKIL